MSALGNALIKLSPTGKWRILGEDRIENIEWEIEPENKPTDEVEIKFKPNRCLIHKSDDHTWHKYGSTTQRCTINSFLVDKSLVDGVQLDNKFIIEG